MHFKEKIYPRNGCGLRIKQTAAVSPTLPLWGRDGEEFPLVRGPHAVELETWMHVSRAQKELAPLAMLPLSIPSSWKSQKNFIRLWKSVFHKVDIDCCLTAADFNLCELYTWSRCFKTLLRKEKMTRNNFGLYAFQGCELVFSTWHLGHEFCD